MSKDLTHVLSSLSDACDTATEHHHAYVSVAVESLRVALAALAPARPPLTSTQRKVYGVLRLCIVERGYFPTLGEMAARLGLRSEATVSEHLDNLEAAGYISRPADRVKGSRAPITLVPPVLP